MSVVPKRLLKSITTLRNLKGQRVFILGTAHISQESCNDTKELIESIKPSVVFLELCDQRRHILSSSAKEDDGMTYTDIFKSVKSGEANAFAVTYSYFLQQMAKSLNVVAGGEFLTANESANVTNSHVVLGDRPIGITIDRLWSGLTFWQKTKMVNEFFLGMIMMMFSRKDKIQQVIDDARTDKDITSEMIKEMGKDYPWLVECLLNERDQFMILELHRVR